MVEVVEVVEGGAVVEVGVVVEGDVVDVVVVELDEGAELLVELLVELVVESAGSVVAGAVVVTTGGGVDAGEP